MTTGTYTFIPPFYPSSKKKMYRSGKIESQHIEDILALTPMQEGMLFHYLQAPGDGSYFNQLSLEVSGDINLQYFESAWNFVLETNEMLRTVFRWEKLEKPTQVVLEKHSLHLRYEDLSNVGEGAVPGEQWEAIKQADRNNPFDLHDVPFRVILGKMSPNCYQMLISNHHILYDGWSSGILLKEFFQAYEALAKGNQPLVPRVKTGFKEFIRWHRQQDRLAQKQFWQKYLAGFDSPGLLPIKRRNQRPGFPGAGNYRQSLGREFKKQLDIFVQDRRVTLAAVFYCAWGVLLQKYCGLEDVVFGTTVSGRVAALKGIGDLVGLFINTVPLRVMARGGESLADLLARVNKDLQDRETHESTPLLEIDSRVGQGLGQGLFDSLVVIENYPLEYFLKGENKTLPLEVRSYSALESTSYDLNLAVMLHDSIEVRWIYNSEVFSQEVISHLSGHFFGVLQEMVSHPDSPSHTVDILSPGEKKQLLLEFNDTGSIFPGDKTLDGLFAGQVGRTPDGVALVGKKLTIGSHQIQLTYCRLDEESRDLARHLGEAGVKVAVPVGILVERSLEMILGILGILRAGCAYVPLDPRAPLARINYILNDSNAGTLLTTGAFAGEVKKLRSWPGEIYYIEELLHPSSLSRSPVFPASTAVKSFLPSAGRRSLATSLAYIIYTSGSTGNPRGVPITHANFSPLVHWGYCHLGIGPSDRSLQNLSYFFDWSVWEIFLALTSGASLYMVPGEVVLEAERYLDFLYCHAITVLHITPTHFQWLISVEVGQRLRSLGYLCLGAEKLDPRLVERSYEWVEEKCRIYNMYGPTEATIMAAVLEIDKVNIPAYKELSNIPLGKNLGNNILLILDRHLQLCPLLVPGELVIGGAGVASGYLNNPELTEERFKIINNKLKIKNESGALRANLNAFGEAAVHHSPFTTHQSPLTIYHTGDLARWLPGGDIEFLGRRDFQVKIRGYRIELGEIESRLLDYPGIKEAVVTAQTGHSGDHLICAYVVPGLGRVGKSLQVSRLKAYLRQKLPDYMVPAYFVLLGAMPLAPSGKVDRKSLPVPEVKSEKDYVEPGDELERTVVGIWSGVLGIDRGGIGIDDNFFQLGGHSLNITGVLGRIYKKLKVEVPFSVFFSGPTVRELAQYVRGWEQSRFRYSDILPVEKKEYYSLSSVQGRLLVLQQMDESGIAYNMPSVWQLEGNLDVEKFETVFQQLIQRHESLRTSIHMVDEEPVQIVHEDIDFKIEVLTTDYTNYLDYTEKNINTNTIIKSFIRPFDLSQGPLLRIELIKIESDRHIFMLDLHHIISDGMSVGIIVKEFMALYAGEEPPALRLQYKDCSEGRRGQVLEGQGVYWFNEFSGEIPVLNLPIDSPRPVVQVFAGAHASFWVSAEERAVLQTLALKANTTLFGVLFSIFTVFLARLSGQEDIVIGTPVTGRKHHDLAGVIGMFVNMLALRSFPVGERVFAAFLKETGAQLVGALENQEYSFEELVERLNLTRDPSRNPLFDAAFALQDPDMPQLKIPGLKVSPYEYDPGTAKFDLTLIAEQVDHRLHFTLQYCTKLFKASTIEGFSRYFKQLVSSIAANPDERISSLNMLSPQEKQQLAFEFNDMGASYPRDKTIPVLFTEQVKKTPDHIALVGPKLRAALDAFGDQGAFLKNRPLDPQKTFYCLTYGELNEQSDGLARWLREKGAQQGTIAGLMMERSIDMIIGILGILKTGSAYMPLDPESPAERVNYMLKDSGAKLIIDETFFGGSRGAVFQKSPPGRRRLPAKESDLFYIIYTSGSSGKPKGVAITYVNFSPLIHWGYCHLDIGTKDRVLQNLSYFFDWSVWEIFITLTTGAGLYMVSRDVIMDPERCSEFIRRHGLTVLHITPTHYSYLVNTGKPMETLRYLFIGAEKLTYGLVKRSLQAVGRGCRIFNMYGPTEATIISAVLEIERSRLEEYNELSSVPIGKPSGNLSLLILDRYLNLCPVRVAGELVIGGDGVARGYLNNPGLSAEKFCLRRPGGFFSRKPPPWTPRKSVLYEKFLEGPGNLFSKRFPGRRRRYKTGDLARWLEDGNVEYLGRIDFQVKIRGYRIELGEIENHLLAYPGVKEAVVMVRESQTGEKYLCAYMVAGEGFEQSRLKNTLAGFLPDYMIPAFFIRMEQMPLNPNKKIDLKALPGPELTAGQDYTAPGNKIEKKLAEIWSGILGIDNGLIGIDDDFFRLGGHSLKATLLASRLEKELRVKVPLAEIFITPTIRGLAEFITHAEEFKFESIEPVEKKEYYPLSSAQKRLFVLQQMDENGIAYNIPSVWRLEGELDTAKFEAGFNELIRRHESLRTSFHGVNDEPVQRIHAENYKIQITKYKQIPNSKSQIPNKEVPCGLLFNNFDEEPSLTPKRDIGTIIKEFIRPFDLSKAPLFRVGLLEQEEQKKMLMVDMHHIVSDGMSIGIFVKEFMELYAGKRPPVLRLQYRDYSEWHHRRTLEKAIKQQEAHWLKEFSGDIPVLDLPTDYPRPAVQDFAGATIHFDIDKDEMAALAFLAKEQAVTLFMLLLSLYIVCLSRISGQEDIVVGTPVAGRRHADLEPLMGMFVNTLVLRHFPDGQKPFSQFLTEVKENTVKAFENQDYLYEDLVEKVDVGRETGRNPLFDTMFSLQDFAALKIEIPGLQVQPLDYETRIAKFDLSLTAIEARENLLFTFEYCAALFKQETIHRFIGYFTKIISTVLRCHDIRISEIEIIGKEEKNRILNEFNDTAVDYPKDKTIHRLFEEQVVQRPGQVALVGPKLQITKYKIQTNSKLQSTINKQNGTRRVDVDAFGEVQLSYGLLNEESNRLAYRLLEEGVHPDTIVGIMVERSVEMIIVIIGILKSRGAYLPIDPDYPRERIDYMLKDSSAKLLVTTINKECEMVRRWEGEKNLEILFLDTHSSPTRKNSVLPNFLTSQLPSFPLFPATGNRQPATFLAYVIYTSGSTGRPKGVMVEHRNVVRLVKNTNFIDIQSDDRILQTGALEFDASTFEVWGALLSGLNLYLTPKENILDPGKLKKLITVNQITTMWFTAPLFNQVVQSDVSIFAGLRNLLVGGDVLSPAHIEQARRRFPGMRIINGYGPTENTTFSTTFLIDKEYKGRIPIGKPIANSTAYIVDKNNNLQPLGLTGELLLGGDGVSRGYLNNPELTYKKFCGGPGKHGGGFSKYPHYGHGRRRQRIYKTGDLARWLPDGKIEFLGRIDHQVKILGFRVELGEIENRLLEHDDIKEVIVVLKTGEQGDKYLCAYIVCKDSQPDKPGCSIKGSGLREYLLSRLPGYMVPSHFIPMDKLPLTPNGKIDRKALPVPGIKASEDYEAPRDTIEKKLVCIWSGVLGIEKEKIGINDNFFHLGGHSLKATILASRIHKELKVNVPLAQVFKTSQIRGLAAFIKSAEVQNFFSIGKVEKKEYYPLSSAQKRLFVLQQMDENGIAYNMPSVLQLQLEGDIDEEKFTAVFQQLIRRHESLRTSFHVVNDEPVQIVHEDIDFNIATEYTEGTEKNTNTNTNTIIKEFIRPFDLSQSPLLRIELTKIERDRHVLMVDMHHIISDGMSIGILVKEFMELYAGKRLPALRLQYKDYSEWLSRQTLEKPLKRQEVYWLKEFSGDLPVLDLPGDYPRPPVQDFKGAVLRFAIHRDVASALKSLAFEKGVTLYMTLLSLYIIFLSILGNQEDIVVGTPVAGRRHADLEGIIGMYVNTLALRNYPSGEKTFSGFLQDVKEKTLRAFENQEYPYEDLVEHAAVNRDPSRNPLFDTMFVLQNIDTTGMEIPGLKLSPYSYDHKISKFDLTLSAIEVEDKLSFTLEYSTKLFTQATIERFIAYFKKIISGVLREGQKNIELSAIEIISTAEKRQILFDFNDTGRDYPRDKTIQRLFEEQVVQRPGQVALVGPKLQITKYKIQTNSKLQSTINKQNGTLRADVDAFGEVQLSYGLLNEESNRLAHILKERGVAADTIVGIMVERSVEMIIVIIGILKSGGAYLPIDPDYPRERIDYMLNDSGAKLLVTTGNAEGEKVRRWEGEKNLEILFLDTHSSPTRKNSVLPNFLTSQLPSFPLFPATGHRPPATSLAYIIYTSGSTGKPKGVMVEHRSVINILSKLQDEYPLRESGTYLLKTSYAFDVSVTELFGWFWDGGQLVVLERGGEKDPQRIIAAIRNWEVTHVNFVPSMFNVFLETLTPQSTRQLSSLKYIFLAGEVLIPGLVEKFRQFASGILLENLYGPTEGTIYASKYSLSAWEGTGSISIGKPLPNLELYILNQCDRLQPVGVSGELCIGGAGVARGYLNNPELTRDKFKIINYKLKIINESGTLREDLNAFGEITPASAANNSVSRRMAQRAIIGGGCHPLYRTGDLGRWLADGNIEFLGRADHQVKIRGFRIELGELESRLLNIEGIKETVVLAREEAGGDKYLCAYFVSARKYGITELREHLAKELPAHMLPPYFVQVEKIPLTPNGKVDRNALPSPGPIIGETDTTPRNAVENKLTEIWSEVLGIEKDVIGIDRNFFELGGHSLKAMVLMSKIHKKLNVKVPLARLFKVSTIRGLAKYIIHCTARDQFVSMEPVEKKEYYALSSAQKRLYFLQQMDLESTAYNLLQIVSLSAETEMQKLEETLTKLIKRHESFRTSFVIKNEEPVQRVHEFGDVEFEIEGFSQEPGSGASIIEDFVRPFDLSRAPLLRVGLVKSAHSQRILMVDMHHIISDGVSMELLVKDFTALYDGEPLPLLRIKYRDFAEWQEEEKENLVHQEKYWLKEFEGEIAVLELPTDYPRPVEQNFEGDSVNFEISLEETRSLNTMALKGGYTLFMVLVAIVNTLLSKLSGQEEVILGTPIAGRRHADLENIIGMFVNTLSLRNYPAGDRTFREFLEDVKKRVLMVFENQEYPFEELVDRLSVQRDMGHNPLFDIMFVLQNMDTGLTGRETETEFKTHRLVQPGFAKEYENIVQTAKFDLTLTAVERNRGLFFSFQYCTKLFRKETIERFIIYFKKILLTAVKEPGIRISEIEIISEKEKKRILLDFNDTQTEYPKDKTIHQLFEAQGERTLDHVALVGPKLQNTKYKLQTNSKLQITNSQSKKKQGAAGALRADVQTLGEAGLRVKSQELRAVTYKELNENSNRLAQVLQSKGVSPDAIVGIMVERSVEMIIGIMSILKSGGAYLPIDPDYPQERIGYMLKDSGAKVLVTTSNLAKEDEKVRSWEGKKDLEIVFLEPLSSSSTRTSGHPGFLTSQPPNVLLFPATGHRPPATSLAYIIYTSGTTGKPKGVLVEHRNAINVVTWFGRMHGLSSGLHVLQISDYIFDASVNQIFGTLLHGAVLYIADKNLQMGPMALRRFMRVHLIQVINFVPAVIHELLCGQGNEKLAGLRSVISGGEKLDDIVKDRILKKGYRLYNQYGPTETTIDALAAECSGQKVNLGKPIANVKCYILDRYHHLLPVGIPGELLVSGAGVSRGYLNNPGLTNERFKIISDKLQNTNNKKLLRGVHGGQNKRFLEKSPPGRRRLYKTGDLARWLESGNIEFLGRIDHQVKIRGFRMEPGEVENQLLSHKEIKEAVVVSRKEKPGEHPCLWGYFVSNRQIFASELREYLAITLPDYMIPSYFVQLERIPLTPNGKVDRKALPIPELDKGIDYIAPRDDIEANLVEIWSGILGIEKEKISIDANFFHLGGHSLKATVLASRIHKELNLNLPLTGIFKTPHIRGLAAVIRKTAGNKLIPVERVERKEYYPLSSAQRRLFAIQQMEENSLAYNMPMVIESEGSLEKERLEEAFKKLIHRHEMLRTSFEILGETVVQRVHQTVVFAVEYYEVEPGGQSLTYPSGEITRNFVRPFDLAKAPLFRACFLKTGKETQVLMTDMHHITSDGVSREIFARDFMALYKGERLSPQELQYKDFTAWQDKLFKSEHIKKQEQYWLDKFSGDLPDLALPYDYPPTIYRGFAGNDLAFEVAPGLTAQLKRMAAENGATLYMVLLAIFTVFLAKYTGHDDVIVASPVAGRRHANLGKVIGIFINVLLLRNFPAAGKTFANFLTEVKNDTLQAYDNQDYPFEDLVKKLQVKKAGHRNPLYEVVFALENVERPDLDIPGLKLKSHGIENRTSKTDLRLGAAERNDKIEMKFTYSTALFKRETAEEMARHYLDMVKQIVENNEIKLGDINISTGLVSIKSNVLRDRKSEFNF